MKRYLNLLAAETMKNIAEMRRYLFDTLSAVVIFYIIFLAMFFGLKGLTKGQVSPETLDHMIIGYILWTFAMTSFQSTSYKIYEESQRGTLEQLYLCSLGMEWTLIFRLILDFIFSFFFSAVMLFITMLTTGRWLSIDIPYVFFVLLLSLPALWGIGLAFGSLSMVFKKTTAFMQIITFGLIGAVSLNGYPVKLVTLIPFTAGATTIRRSITGAPSFPASWYLTIALISLVYLTAGIVIFKVFEREARKKNLLNQY